MELQEISPTKIPLVGLDSSQPPRVDPAEEPRQTLGTLQSMRTSQSLLLEPSARAGLNDGLLNDGTHHQQQQQNHHHNHNHHHHHHLQQQYQSPPQESHVEMPSSHPGPTSPGNPLKFWGAFAKSWTAFSKRPSLAAGGLSTAWTSPALSSTDLDGHPTNSNNVDEKRFRRMQKLREEYRFRRLVRRQEKMRSVSDWFQNIFHYRNYWQMLNNVSKDKQSLSFLVIFNLLLDVFACALSIYEIETCHLFDDDNNFLINRPYWLWMTLVVLSVYHVVTLLIRLTLAHDRRALLFHPMTFVDLITAVPFIVSLGLEDGQFLDVPYFFRIWMVVDRLRLFLNLRVDVSPAGTPIDPLTLRLTYLISMAVAFIFTWTCLFHYSEMIFAEIRYRTLDSLYCVIITAATVGYGDIAPKAQVTRFIMIGMIILAIALSPRLINGVLETYRTRKEGQHSYVPGRQPYVVVFLSYSKEQYIMDVLSACFQAFTRKMHFVKKRNAQSLSELSVMMTSYQIVLVSTKQLSSTVKTLLSSRQYQSRFTFILGSALEESDLRRSGVRNSSACFILSDRSKGAATELGMEEDHQNVLRVWSVRKYASRTPVYISNLRPETDLHVRPLSRQVICVNSIKQLILGLSCLHRGSAALITNLIHQAPPLSKYQKSWQVVYSDGIRNGIHMGPFNPLFVGKRFSELAWYLYAEFQVIIIGLRFRIPAEILLHNSQTSHQGPEKVYTYRDHLVLNPGPNYIIPAEDIVRECVFIAQSIEDIVDIEHLTPAQFEESWAKWIRWGDADDIRPMMQFPTNEDRCPCRYNAAPAEHRKPREATSMNDMRPAENQSAQPVDSNISVLTSVATSSTAPGATSTATDRALGTPGLSRRAKQRSSRPAYSDQSDSDSDLASDENPPQSTRNPTIPPIPKTSPDETYIGHPRPPHHMVLDNDLQSPFCHILKVQTTTSTAGLSDATRFEPFDRSMAAAAAAAGGSKRRMQGWQDGYRASIRGTSRHLERHVILCSGNYGIWTYLCTMRASYIPIESLQPILILCPTTPTDEEWRPLSVFPQVYFMQGDPMKRNDLIRAGLYSSSCVVMLKHPTSKARGEMNERFVDSTAIMATHQIDFMVRDKYVITELLTRHNIKFMRAKMEMLDSAPLLTTAPKTCSIPPIDISHSMRRFTYRHTVPHGEMGYVRGDETAFEESDTESVIQRTTLHQNPFQPASRSPPISTEEPGYYAHSAIFASGRVLAGDMFDGLVFEAFRTPGLVDVVKLLCGRRYQKWTELNDHLKLQASILCSVPLPKVLIHMAFHHGVIPIAIYRQKTEHTHRPLSPMHSNLNTGRSPVGPKPGFQFVPLRRAATDMSVASVSSVSKHLFNMEANVEDGFASDTQDYTFTGAEAAQNLNRLLEESNRVDNDLPFVVTNPLPDFVLDELDCLFVLRPE